MKKSLIDIGDGFNLRTIVALLDPQPSTYVCLSQRFANAATDAAGE